MSRGRVLSLVLFTVVISGCYMPIRGRVIDAETQQPIEGAVVLVEWTKTHGIGEHWTESAKVVEVVSDKEGRVELPGCYDPFVRSPNVTIYKKGYVAWNNYLIFRGTTERRMDYEWKSGYVFNLEKFMSNYSYINHWLFIAPLLPHTNKPTLLEKKFGEGENEAVRFERAGGRNRNEGAIKQ